MLYEIWIELFLFGFLIKTGKKLDLKNRGFVKEDIFYVFVVWFFVINGLIIISFIY